MSIIRNTVLFLGSLLLTHPGWAGVKNTEVHFNSSCDFTALTVDVIREQTLDPALITLNITLQPAASRRLAQVTRDHMNQSLTMYINGMKINTSTIRAELNSAHLQVVLEKQRAVKLFPSLLNTTCLQAHP